MRRFRPPSSNPVPGAVNDLLAVGQMIDDAMRPGHFFVGPELRLSWIAARAETIAWELFRGRLLDETQTREQKTFLAWSVVAADDSNQAVISVKLDVPERQIHVTRGFSAYAWEGYDAGGGVIESREVTKWARELVGTIALAEYPDLESVRDELLCLLWQAVVGTSRLPLTSLEAPLPAFVFGQFHYVNHTDAEQRPMTTWRELLDCSFPPDLAEPEGVKLIEFILRAVNLPDLFLFLEAYSCTRVISPALWRAMFNRVSLSPYTQFVNHALISIDLGTDNDSRTDFHAHLLRQLSRHLTAYDLITFHHRGANYPDALLLDEVLKRFLDTAKMFPDLFLGDEPTARMRRRALRQGCLARWHYEGHLVPDLPTSPGENARLMPASHPRVAEEQLTQMNRRRRQLFATDPLAEIIVASCTTILAQAVADLEYLDERVEMGLGLFIDRPLGYARDVGEPDLTPLLAHEAFSLSLARRRWQELKRLCQEVGVSMDERRLDPHFATVLAPGGLPHQDLADCPRPTAALADVRKVADDFVILRTLPVGLTELLRHFDWRALGKYSLRFFSDRSIRLYVQAPSASDGCRAVTASHPSLARPANMGAIAIYDVQLRRRLELVVDGSQGFDARAGVELPRAGLRVVRIWEDTDDPGVLVKRECDIHLRAK